MGLVNEEIDVLLQSSMITYYENLGYEIPRVKKNYKWAVPQGTKLRVKVNDLKESSNNYVEAICDCCGKHNNLMYCKYNKNVKSNNGFYLCSTNTEHKDFRNGLSVEKIMESIKDFYNKNDRFPKYNEYTKDNGFSFSYSQMMDRLKRNNLSLNEELAKIDCFKLSKSNIEYYDDYVLRLKEVIKENPNIGKDLYSLSRDDNCRVFGLPNIRWFIEHCPDESVNNIDTFKEWAGLYTKHMSKEQCTEIILDMVKKYDRPLMYDDFRGHEYGQVTIQMIRDHWGSLNKMKQALGLEINIESMMDRQLSSKEELDNMIVDICNFVHNENRDFITTREINANSDWISADSLQKTAKKFYNCKLQDLLAKYGVSLGRQGCGINFDFSDGEHVTSQFEYMFSKYLKENGFEYNKSYFRDVKYRDFIPNYTGNMNCDYVIEIDGTKLYIEIAGIIVDYKTWYYEDRVITHSKSKEKYRLKLREKEQMLKDNGLNYFILFPCDLTKENFNNVLFNRSEKLQQDIEGFYKNNIDWEKVRKIGELDYSQDVIRKDFRRRRKEAV